MAGGATENVDAEVAFMVLLAAVGHSVTALVFALYPFEFSGRTKRRAVRQFICINCAAGLLVVGVLAIAWLSGMAELRAPDEVQAYVWGVSGIGIAHGVLLQAPAAAISKAFDRDAQQALGNIADGITIALYLPAEKDRTMNELRTAVNSSAEMLSDYGLVRLAQRFVEPRDTILGEVGLELLSRTKIVLSGLNTRASPFAELNFVISLAGVSAGLALIAAIASSGG